MPRLAGKAIEKLLSVAGAKVIATDLGKVTVTKKEIGRFFQERYAQHKPISFDTETLENVQALLNACGKKLI